MSNEEYTSHSTTIRNILAGNTLNEFVDPKDVIRGYERNQTFNSTFQGSERVFKQLTNDLKKAGLSAKMIGKPTKHPDIGPMERIIDFYVIGKRIDVKRVQKKLEKKYNLSLSTIPESVEESTKAYGDTLKQIAKDRQLKKLSKKDRDTLIKIADLLKKEDIEEADTVAGDVAGKDIPMKMTKRDKDEMEDDAYLDEALKPGPIDGRTLAGKIITGEVKLLTVKQGSPGRRGQTYIMATGKPSIMGSPPESIYIDATGARPRGSGLAIGFEIKQIQKAEILRDGSARVELK